MGRGQAGNRHQNAACSHQRKPLSFECKRGVGAGDAAPLQRCRPQGDARHRPLQQAPQGPGMPGPQPSGKRAPTARPRAAYVRPLHGGAVFAKSSNLAHALPFDQIKGDDFVYGAAGFFNAVQQNFCTALGQLLHILPNGRQARDAVLPQGNAVVPGY